MRSGIHWLGVTGLVAGLILAMSGSASAASSFQVCVSGSSAGQCEKPEGIGVDRSNGRVYVAERGNHRISAFEADGSFVMAFGWGVRDGSAELQSCTVATTCRQGIPGSGPGQLKAPVHIAVDNVPASIAYRNIYVVDENLRVQRFNPAGELVATFGAGQINDREDPVGVGPGGTVYVGDSKNGNAASGRIMCFEPPGTLVGLSQLQSGGLVLDLAVDSNADVYVKRNSGIEKYEPKCVQGEPAAPLYSLAVGINTTGISIDSSDNLFAAQAEEGVRVITAYDSIGDAFLRFGYGLIGSGPKSLAVAAAGNGVFGSEEFGGVPGNRVLFIPLPPPGPLACCLEAAPIGNASATIRAKLNPESKATTYRVEYVDDATYQEDIDNEGAGHGFDHAKASTDGVVAPDVSLHPVSTKIGCPNPVTEFAEGKCLLPETLYHYRLIAENADTPPGEPTVVESSFTTKPPFEASIFTTDVGTDAAQLHAAVNPLGTPATGYFEYIDDATFKAVGFTGAIKTPDVSGGQAPFGFGSAEAVSTRFVQLSSLTPGTTYHYRVVVGDLFTPPGGIAGPDQTFHTFPVPKPPSVSCPNKSFRTGPSANLPNCRAYEMVSPIDKNGGDIEVLPNILEYPAELDQSAAGGDRFSYSSATAFADAQSAPFSSQYIASRKVGVAWSTHAISPPRESISLAEMANAKFDVQFKAFSGDISNGWLVHDSNPPLDADACAPADFLNVYRRDNDSDTYEALTIIKPPSPASPKRYWPEVQGVSADGTHTVFVANGKLTKDASSALIGSEPIYQLYEHVSGKGCGTLRLVSVLPGGTASPLASSAGTLGPGVPGEGRENTVARAVSADGSRIFWSTGSSAVPGPLYVRIDGKETIEISSQSAQFWTAATDGSKAVYTVDASLYEFDVGAKAKTLIAEDAIGVAAASEDASRIYFVSSKVLAAGAKAGVPNIYLHEAGIAGSKFVATLAARDVGGNFREVGFAVARPKPLANGVRATPDGGHLLFISTASPTGYDNTDIQDGRPDMELFLYDAGTEKLACVSCNPAGSRPAGREFEGSNGDVRRVAAQLPPLANDLTASRALSGDGNRLFFESFESLVPRDTNGKGDVYEWERAGGAEQCGEMGAELFVGEAGGCLSLISSGQSPSDSELVDASADGRDVFIRTVSSLLPQDPGQVDIYDARIEGGLPVPPPPPPECEGQACQGSAVVPENQTPASPPFVGAGNLPNPRGCPKGKRKVRRNGKVRCVPKRAHHQHHKRARYHRRAAR